MAWENSFFVSSRKESEDGEKSESFYKDEKETSFFHAHGTEVPMKKTVPFFLFFFVMTAFLLPGEKAALAASSGQVSCGDYELVTRKRNDDGKEREVLYRINNKTGETWLLEERDIGWVKLREQV